MNDSYMEKCETCKHSKLMRDNHDEFYRCLIGKHCSTCEGDRSIEPVVKIVAFTPNPLAVIEKAASMCYDSKPTKSGRIANACYQSGHTSVFEHASFTFELTGVSRAFLAQITRHRIASFSVRSQRYCKEDGFQYIMPKSVMKDNTDAKFFVEAMDSTTDIYQLLVDSGIEPEDARFVLPNACETKMIVTMNVRELISFCGLRLCTRAQWEIRGVVRQMVECVNEVAPEIAKYLKPNCERYAPYCFCTEGKPCGKYPSLREVFEKSNA